jgi:hypothetical protein
MTKQYMPEGPTPPPAHPDAMTKAERRRLDDLNYWMSSFFIIGYASVPVMDGLAIPVVGGLEDMALDHSIVATVAMLQHPDATVRWAEDTAFVRAGRLLAIVRALPGGAAVTRFDPITPLPGETVKPGRRAPRSSSIFWVGGSLEATAQGLGIPLDGRDLAVAMDDTIRSICDGVEDDDLATQDFDDMALSFRGRFLAAIRFMPAGPVVTRFDLPDSPSGGADEPSEGSEQPAFPVLDGGQDGTRQSTVELPQSSDPGAND